MLASCPPELLIFTGHERRILTVHYVQETDIVRRTSALSPLLTEPQQENSKVLRWQIICPQDMFREGCAGGPGSVVIVIRRYVPLCVCVPGMLVCLKVSNALYKWTGSKIPALIDVIIHVKAPPARPRARNHHQDRDANQRSSRRRVAFINVWWDSFFLSSSLANSGQHSEMSKRQTHAAKQRRRGSLSRHILSESIVHTVRKHFKRMKKALEEKLIPFSSTSSSLREPVSCSMSESPFFTVCHSIKYNGVKCACLQRSGLFLIHQFPPSAPQKLASHTIPTGILILAE